MLVGGLRHPGPPQRLSRRGKSGQVYLWLEPEGAQGHAYAQFDLGLMFAAGSGVARDYVRAHMWVTIAIAQGNEHMIKHRHEIAKNMTPTEIAKARRLALDWLERRQE